jgi:hypothetical protein
MVIPATVLSAYPNRLEKSVMLSEAERIRSISTAVVIFLAVVYRLVE